MTKFLRTCRARTLVGILVGVLGTAGMSASVLPSFAQETRPAASQDQTSPPPPGLHEGQAPANQPGQGPVSGQGRTENLAADLRLQSARIESLNLDDTDEEYAVYQFGRFVHEVKDPSGFTMQSFDVDNKATAADARLLQGDTTSVLVGFPSGTDLSRYTLASVETGAVVDEADEGNLPATVPLSGSTTNSSTNLTDGPDLLSIRANNSLDRAVYTFDEQVDEQNKGDTAKFGYYTADGKMVSASSVVTAEGNTVTVAFDRQVEDGVLFYSLSGATKNDRGITSSPGTIGTGTTSPDLASVSDVIGQSQWDFTFDEPVTDVALDHFVVYSADGSAYSAKSFTRPSAEVVRIAIPELHEFPAKMVLAAVEDGAVKADDDSKTPSIIGARRIGTLSPATGLLSSGPELASFQTDDTTGQVRFVFNQPIDDDLTYEPKDFMVITPAGDLVQGRTFVEVKDNSVLMDFDKNIVEAAQGVAINEGAVKDYQGEKNPARTLMTTRSGIPAGTQSTLAPSSGPEIEKSSPSDSSTATASTPAPSVPAETQSGSSETQGDSTETPSNSTETPSNSTEIRRSPPETESRSQERPTTGQPVGAVR